MGPAFESERPRLLGVLLDALAEGLKRLPETFLPKLPRMADFALWATACETTLWPAGTFWSAYCGNRDEAVEYVIDADPVASAVRAVMLKRMDWTGTASQLLSLLEDAAGERVAKSKDWPASARALSGRLRRAATFLRKIGIEVAFLPRKGHVRDRMIRISAALNPATPEFATVAPSPSSASSAIIPRHNGGNDTCPLPVRTVDRTAADATVDTVRTTVRINSLESEAADGADDADAKIPTSEQETDPLAIPLFLRRPVASSDMPGPAPDGASTKRVRI